LQQVLQGSNAEILMQVIIDALFVYFNVDGMTTFEGNKIDIQPSFKEKDAPFMFNLHCVAHKTNLVVQTLSELSLVSKIVSLLHLMYNDYAQSLSV
jgi:type III secretory pathway component EscU